MTPADHSAPPSRLSFSLASFAEEEVISLKERLFPVAARGCGRSGRCDSLTESSVKS